MKTNFHSRHCHAWTKTEVLIVVVTIVLLTGVFLPRFLGPNRTTARRIDCASKLRAFGVGFRIWSNDNDDRFPWEVSTNKGGTLEFANSSNVFLHFLPCSVEVSTPKILICQSDTSKVPSTNFAQFDNRNLSYFIGLTASESDPESILFGDRNVTTNGVAIGNGVFQIATNGPVGWTTAMHNKAGNILLSDGSVSQTSVPGLQTQWQASTNVARRLAVP